MKRFKWPLQRLLDVTVQREKVLRSELLALLSATAAARQDIFRHRGRLRAVLDNLAGDDLQRRIPRQELYMRFSHVAQKDLERLAQRLGGLEDRRKSTMAKFMKARSTKEQLQKLRQKSLGRYMRRQLRLEQKMLDESSQLSFARDLAERQASPIDRSR